jgi:gas vesicle protein
LHPQFRGFTFYALRCIGVVFSTMVLTSSKRGRGVNEEGSGADRSTRRTSALRGGAAGCGLVPDQAKQQAKEKVQQRAQQAKKEAKNKIEAKGEQARQKAKNKVEARQEDLQKKVDEVEKKVEEVHKGINDHNEKVDELLKKVDAQQKQGQKK